MNQRLWDLGEGWTIPYTNPMISTASKVPWWDSLPSHLLIFLRWFLLELQKWIWQRYIFTSLDIMSKHITLFTVLLTFNLFIFCFREILKITLKFKINWDSFHPFKNIFTFVHFENIMSLKLFVYKCCY